jgi:hypothetical protein
VLADGRANHDRAIGEHDPFAIVHGASVRCRLDFVNAGTWHATAPASPTASASNAGARGQRGVFRPLLITLLPTTGAPSVEFGSDRQVLGIEANDQGRTSGLGTLP